MKIELYLNYMDWTWSKKINFDLLLFFVVVVECELLEKIVTPIASHLYKLATLLFII